MISCNCGILADGGRLASQRFAFFTGPQEASKFCFLSLQKPSHKETVYIMNSRLNIFHCKYDLTPISL